MSVDDRIRRRLRVRAARMEPELARRQLEAYRLLRDVLTEAELVKAIDSGTLDLALDALLDDANIDPAFQRLRAHLHAALFRAGSQAAKDAPFTMSFILNGNVLDALDALDTRVVGGLADDVRDTVKQHVRAGIEAGKHPRTVARGARKVIGLAPNQEEAVRNFEAMLRDGSREALTRELRDKRFDRTLQKALGRGGTGLTDEQIAKMTDAYRRRMIAFNAETQAKTLAMDSQRLAQRLAWENAVDQGILTRADIERTWVDSGDSRVRPEHRDMNGTTVGMDEPYPNGEMVPGDSTYNCRCVERYRKRRARLSEAA